MTELDSPNFTEVEWFAQHAAMAYNSEAEIRAAYPNTTLVATSKERVQFFLETDPVKKQQIVAVRGTSNLANAREDADYRESRNPQLDIWVHRGFDADAEVVYQMLDGHLQKDFALILTGHSLGAAIATLLMMIYREAGYTIAPTYNFGQPKVTNGKGVAKYADLPLCRVVDENDLVPFLPPLDFVDGIHGGYEHLGTELVLLRDDYYSLLSEPRAEKESVTDFWRNLGHESIREHYMANYLTRIQSKLVQAQQVPYGEREKYCG